MQKLEKIMKNQKIAIVAIIIVLGVVFSCINPTFIRLDNLMDLMKSYCVLGIVSCGMFVVIVSGGIDVSVGAIISASACLAGTFLVRVNDNIVLGFLVATLVGTLLGAINGLLIAKVEIPPLIVTLGTMSVINGIMVYLTNGAWITDLPEELVTFGQIRLFKFQVTDKITTGIPIQVLFLIAIALLTWFLMKHTLFGRGVYALGGDEASAKRIGFNTAKIQFLIYVYLGFTSGLASMVHTSVMRQVDPNAFKGYEMTVLSAVVIGGTNIAGGSGTVSGVILGVLFLAIVNNGLVLSRVSSYHQSIIVGMMMLLAISFDAIRKKRVESKRSRIDVE